MPSRPGTRPAGICGAPLLAQARTLLRRAAEHLRAHRDEFPEYDPENDIFNRCTTDGGFVQIR